MIAPRLEERLLARATFGPRPGEREALRRSGAEAWLARQLAPERIDDAALEDRLGAFPNLSRRPDSLLRGVGGAEGMMARRAGPLTEEERARTLELRRLLRRIGPEVAAARLVRGAHSRRQLLEVMVDFWSNHFSVSAFKGRVAELLPHYDHDVIRAHALGRFEDLLLEVARSPAMLVYLDNWISTRPRRTRRGRGGINENYARELLELHTLGVAGGYSQDDVVEVARVLTGWSLRSRREPVFRFRPGAHDPGPKRVLGERVPGSGVEQGEWLLRRLARHPATARHLAQKLLRRFVADDPPAELVGRVARVYLESEGAIGAVLRAILLSPDFAAPERRKLKTPLEFALSAVRETGGETKGGRPLVHALRRMGELPYFARSPEGFPDEVVAWVDPGSMLERIAVALALSFDAIDGTTLGPELPHGVRPSAPGLGDPRHVTFLALAAPEFQWQ